MTKAVLGAKRKCLACNTSFFDLQRDPIVCPKCKTVFIPPPPLPVSYKRKAPLPAVPTPKVEQEATPENNLELVQDDEDADSGGENDPAESDEVPDDDSDL